MNLFHLAQQDLAVALILEVIDWISVLHADGERAYDVVEGEAEGAELAVSHLEELAIARSPDEIAGVAWDSSSMIDVCCSGAIEGLRRFGSWIREMRRLPEATYIQVFSEKLEPA